MRRLLPMDFKRQYVCGRQRRKVFGAPAQLKVTRSKWGTANIAGLVCCGSKWICPMCAAVIDRRRSDELRKVLARHSRIGGGDCLVTLTTAHDNGTALKPLRQHVSRAFQACIRGAPWKRFAARFGIVGYVRGAEQTHGANGWHPHLHVVFFTRRPLNDEQRDELAGWLFQRWARAIAKPHKETGTLFRAPLEFTADGDRVGVTCTTLSREDYVTKLGLAEELGSSGAKSAGNGHRTAFEILRDCWAADCSNPTDNALYVEYAGEMHGAQSLTWSRGLRKRYGDDWIERDLDIVEDDGGQDVCEIPEDAAALVVGDYRLQLRIRNAAEHCTLEEAAERVLDLIQRRLDKIAGLPTVPF